jgi:hypothetical protein
VCEREQAGGRDSYTPTLRERPPAGCRAEHTPPTHVLSQLERREVSQRWWRRVETIFLEWSNVSDWGLNLSGVEDSIFLSKPSKP